MVSGLSSVVKRHPLITFFVLAYAFSWWPWPLYALGLAPGYIIGFGPFLAVLVVLGPTRGKAGILGMVWAFWHLPLMVYGTIPWSDVVYVTVVSVVYTWLFNTTGGSVLLVMLFHTMNNVIWGYFFHAMYTGADWVRMGWLWVVLWLAVALVVTIANGPEHLSRKHKKQTPLDASSGVAKPTPV